VYLLATFALFGQFMNNDAMYASFGFASQPKIVGLLLFMSTIFTPIDHFVSFLTVRTAFQFSGSTMDTNRSWPMSFHCFAHGVAHHEPPL